MSDISFLVENELSQYVDMFKTYCPPPLFVKKGTVLTRQCKSGGWLYFVLDGLLKTYVDTSNGSQRIIDFMYRNTIVGMDCLDPDSKAVVSIECVTDSSVLPFTPDILKKMIKLNPQFGYDIVLYYGKILRQVTYGSAALGAGSRTGRIANFLFLYTDTEYYAKYGEIHISQEDIAAAVGTSLSQVARVLRKFREEQVISTSNKRILILDKDKLKKYCEF